MGWSGPKVCRVQRESLGQVLSGEVSSIAKTALTPSETLFPTRAHPGSTIPSRLGDVSSHLLCLGNCWRSRAMPAHKARRVQSDHKASKEREVSRDCRGRPAPKGPRDLKVCRGSRD